MLENSKMQFGRHKELKSLKLVIAAWGRKIGWD